MRFAAFLLALFPLAAPALTPAPDCYVNEANGLLVSPTDESGTFAVWPQRHPGGVVTWDWIDRSERAQGAVQICDGGRALRYSIPNADFEPLFEQLYERLQSEQVYSLSDLRAVVRAAGGRAWSAADLGRCGCDLHGF